jgi:ribosome-associated protein
MQEKKAAEVTLMDMKDLTYFTDYFVICCGESEPQIRSIYKYIDEKMSAEGIEAHHIEGRSEGGWILMDYRDFVVHIFSPQKRSFYDLERLWADAPRMNFKDQTSKAPALT